jgi:hypothetical protein
MKTDTAAELLIKKLIEQRTTLIGEIIRLPLPQEEYARIRGVIQGLDFAVHTINDLAKSIDEDEEIDNG